MTIRFSIKNLMSIAAVCLVAYIIYMSRQVIFVTIFGLLLAYMLNPIVSKLVSCRIIRPLATAIVLLLCSSVLLLFALWVLPRIYHDINSFIDELPSYIMLVMQQAAKLGARFNLDLSDADLYRYFISSLKNSGMSMLTWMGGVAGSLEYALAFTANIILVPVISFFALAGFPKIQAFMDHYIGQHQDRGMRKYISLFSDVMSSYFRGQFAVMAILCVFYSVTLSIVGLDMAILLGVLTGLLSIVPYLGFTIGIFLSMLMAAIEFQDIWHPIYVVIGYMIVQVIESFIITPKIMENSLGIHPLAIIIVLLIGGATFGLMGMIFALPVASALFTLYKQRYFRHRTASTEAEPQR